MSIVLISEFNKEETSIHIKFEHCNLSKNTQYDLCAIDRKSTKKTILKSNISVSESYIIKFDIEELCRKLDDYKMTTLDVCIVSNDENIQLKYITNLNGKTKFLEPLLRFNKNSWGAFYFNLKSELSIMITDRLDKISSKFDKVKYDVNRLENDNIKTIIKRDFNIKNISLNQDILHLESLDSVNFNKLLSIKIYLMDRNSSKLHTFNINKSHIKSKSEINVPLNIFIDKYLQRSRWDLYIEYIEDEMLFFGRVGMFYTSFNNKLERYFLENISYENEVLVPYVTEKNYISILINGYQGYINERYKHEININKIKCNNGKITIGGILKFKENFDYDISNVLMCLRNNTKDPLKYTLDVDTIKKNDNRIKYEFTVDAKKLNFEQFYWDVYLEIKSKNDTFYIRIKKPTRKIKKKINNSILKYTTTLNNGYIVYPYLTIHNALSFTYRKKVEYEGLFYKLKEKIAEYSYKLLKLYYDKKDIWLIYEKFSETAQDNGFYFFKYCCEKYPDKSIYYILNKNSKDYKNIQPYKDKVVHFMSIKHLIYLCAAKVLVASESKGHAYIQRSQTGYIRNKLYRKKLVFLQHGVIALKKIDGVFKKNSANVCDLFVVSSNYEKNIIKNIFNYNDDEIIVTGLTRWDVLKDKSNYTEVKEIFFMPTWRNWLDDAPKEEFENSSYFRNYMKILNSKKLDKILKKNNVIINYFVHPKFKNYIDKFSTRSDRIKIVQPGDMQVNELLMRASLLITDYSSVAWEMYYQNKPTLFYHFDVDDYNKYQGSYLDFDKEIFGNRAFNPNELIKYIEKYIDTNFKLEEKFENMREKYFEYTDNNNCDRVYDMIMKNKENLYKAKLDKPIKIRIINKINRNKIFIRYIKPIENSRKKC